MIAPTDLQDLLPCPFCGGAPELDTHQGYRNIATGRHETCIAAYCTECSASQTICRGDVPDVAPQDVIDLWNRRPAGVIDSPSSPVSLTDDNATLIERTRIADAIDYEASVTPCTEDAMVVRDIATLVRANFSYEDAERLSEERILPTASQGEEGI